MKKIVTLFCAVLFSTAVFADFFGPRFFEMTTSVPFSATNNLFMLDDIMKKNAVIDLAKLADSLPESGFNVIVNSNPYYGMNLNIKDFHTGFKAGVDAFSKFTLSKDLFDFIGHGNELYEDIDIQAIITGDVFFHLDFNCEFKMGNFKFGFMPSAFLPLAHVSTENSHITFTNSEDGTVGIDMLSTATLYTLYDFTDTDLSADKFLNGIGCDFTGRMEYLYSDSMSIFGSLRVPIYPGHLSSYSYYTLGMNAALNLTSIAEGNLDGLKPAIESTLAEKTLYSIHRPLKAYLQADFKPIGPFCTINAGFGIGIRNPFAKEKSEIAFYPEYYFGCKLNAGGFANCCFSTEYKDELYKHQISGMVNFRLIQFELGLAAASASISSSFKGSGLSLYFITSWGF